MLEYDSNTNNFYYTMNHIPTIENLKKFASENIKNVPLHLHHISKNNFEFPDIQYIRKGFIQNKHHPKATFGLWTTNLSPISGSKDEFYFYEASLKENSRVSLISSSSFAQIFSEMQNHFTFIYSDFSNDEHPTLLTQNEEAYFSYLNNLISYFQYFADVLVLVDKFDNSMIEKMNDDFINHHLSSQCCEIIILNLESILEWKQTSSILTQQKKQLKT